MTKLDAETFYCLVSDPGPKYLVLNDYCLENDIAYSNIILDYQYTAFNEQTSSASYSSSKTRKKTRSSWSVVSSSGGSVIIGGNGLDSISNGTSNRFTYYSSIIEVFWSISTSGGSSVYESESISDSRTMSSERSKSRK